MKAYLGVICAWLVASFCFINSYYAFRFPEKYIKARWTAMRGLPRHPSSAAIGGALSLLVGAIFFTAGLMILHGILTR
jgi:hypothetical protein